MSVWTTRSSGRDRTFIVIQHKIKGVNYVVNGIKFRDGYAVVEKDSKTYRNLMTIPALRGAQEFPLSFLRKLKFVTRTSDIKNIFGQEVYIQYLKELDVAVEADIISEKEKVAKILEEKHKQTKCSHRLDNGNLCGVEALDYSPSQYCGNHLFEDPKFSEMGISIPRFMTKKEKVKVRENLVKQLQNIKKKLDNG